MDDDDRILVDAGYMKAKNVTLTSEQVHYIEELQRKLEFGSFSATMRFCLSQYIAEEKRITKAIQKELGHDCETTQA